MGTKLRLLVLAVLAVAGCQSQRGYELPDGFGDTSRWPHYVCDKGTGKTAAQMLDEIVVLASAPPPTVLKIAVQVQAGFVYTLPDDPVKNPHRCQHVMAALAAAKIGDWQTCFVELDQCN